MELFHLFVPSGHTIMITQGMFISASLYHRLNFILFSGKVHLTYWILYFFLKLILLLSVLSELLEVQKDRSF